MSLLSIGMYRGEGEGPTGGNVTGMEPRQEKRGLRQEEESKQQGAVTFLPRLMATDLNVYGA